MQVIKARAWGMCEGVRRAMERVREIKVPGDVTIYGELVHNEEINREMKERGFHSLSEANREKQIQTAEVLITAHGLSEKEKTGLLNQGKTLIDTTCPLVKRIHKEAQRLQDEGYFVVILGKAGHVEVKGITGDLTRFAVVDSVDSVRTWITEKIGVICQSTLPPVKVPELLEAIRGLNPGKEIRWVNTICKPTRDRQNAIIQLAGQVDMLVVVGGLHSNNTRQLAALGGKLGMRVLQVQSARELYPSQFEGVQRVGLTAGTSTPDWVVEEIYQSLCLMNQVKPFAIEKEALVHAS
jgi:4-hydroxy-3-methylbut-2-enyl diphosphate reductase